MVVCLSLDLTPLPHSTAQLASTSVATLTGLDTLAAAGGGAGGGGGADPSAGKKGNKLLKSLGFGSSKPEEQNDYTHMRCVCAKYK